MTLNRVIGCCPACGAEDSLIVTWDGFIRCLSRTCPHQLAVSQLLDDPEVHHVVAVTDIGFTIKHPLIERIDDQLLRCTLLTELHEGDDTLPDEPGRYRVRRVDDEWQWEAL